MIMTIISSPYFYLLSHLGYSLQNKKAGNGDLPWEPP